MEFLTIESREDESELVICVFCCRLDEYTISSPLCSMRNSNANIMFAFLWFLSSIISTLCLSNNLVCIEKEKQALLSFKQALTDPFNELSSWSVEEDCCRWMGVSCDNITGQVIELHLYGLGLGGKISPALLQLVFLHYLDLSENSFGGSPIPSFLGSMQRLRYLALSYASFGGLIPPELGNLSNLHHLRMGGFSYDLKKNFELYVENLSWISHLSSLQYLWLTDIDLHRETLGLQPFSMLSSLSELYLVACQLNTMSPSLAYVKFTSLTVLYISENHFDHEIPNWLFNISTSLLKINLWGNSLKVQIPNTLLEFPYLNALALSENKLTGQIPECLGQLKHLEDLELNHNSLDGPIPSSLGNLSSLRSLSLDGNRLNGTLPRSLGLLSSLRFFKIGNNSLSGTVSEVHFESLSKLKWLDMSSTSLLFNLKSNWIPPFQLDIMWISSCKIGPKFPAWLRTQRSLSYLDISKAGIVDTPPKWFWKWASHIQFQVSLSDNQMFGDLSEVLLNSTFVDLSSNCFTGQLPRLSSNLIVLNMANNSFSGPISNFLCQKLNGKSNLEMLDVSNNDLSGDLSQCWTYWQSLTHINLGRNKFSGKIPNSMSSLFALQALHLNNNNLSGNMPTWLQNWTSLGLLDLGGNKLLGNIPSWLGELKALMALRLRSNKFVGSIPSQICQPSSLIVLDLADNKLSGTIPKCLNNFSLMATMDTIEIEHTGLGYFKYQNHLESLQLITQGREVEYKEILQYVRMIDFSKNNLSGLIPTELLTLVGLRFLNLSRNHLIGSIPEKIGGMESLLSLDLSRNHLSGEIPPSMGDLTFLNYLDLSYNNLSGRIPSSTQLQSFDALSYFPNAELCGLPLMKNCTEEEKSQGENSVEENGEGFEISWFYMGMGFGFIVGFWGAFGTLILKTAWRFAYFQFLDDIKDQIYVASILNLNWFRNHLRR